MRDPMAHRINTIWQFANSKNLSEKIFFLKQQNSIRKESLTQVERKTRSRSGSSQKWPAHNNGQLLLFFFSLFSFLFKKIKKFPFFFFWLGYYYTTEEEKGNTSNIEGPIIITLEYSYPHTISTYDGSFRFFFSPLSSQFSPLKTFFFLRNLIH